MKFLRNVISVVVVFMLISWSARAQDKEVSSSTNAWFMVMNEIRLSPMWSVSNEVHIRRADFIDSWQQFLIRPAVNYRLNPNLEFSVGYSYILTYPYGEQPVKIKTPEHNIWQQVQIRQLIGKVGISHRYRLEERFIGQVDQLGGGNYVLSGSNYAQRFRYRLTVRVPLLQLGNDKEIFAAAFDELWVNLENNFSVESFNQNWFYAGLGYQFNDQANLQAGYLNQLIRKADGIHFEKNPTLSVSLFYNFDLSN